MFVKDIMTENPACCTPDTNLQEVAKMMLDNDCGAIPVVENNNHKIPIGVVTDRDITIRTIAKGDNPLNMTAKSVMTKNVFTVTADTPVEECVDLMEENQVRRVPVVDENGNCIGMVAQADIAIKASDGDAEDMVEEVSKASASQ
ncbi:MAG TPA: CBS domain-containing protein [Pyrinomonadaceae bacterium]|jgi:CBS domain-containing protein